MKTTLQTRMALGALLLCGDCLAHQLVLRGSRHDRRIRSVPRRDIQASARTGTAQNERKEGASQPPIGPVDPVDQSAIEETLCRLTNGKVLIIDPNLSALSAHRGTKLLEFQG